MLSIYPYWNSYLLRRGEVHCVMGLGGVSFVPQTLVGEIGMCVRLLWSTFSRGCVTACNIEGKQLLVGGGERADVLPLRGSRVLCVPHSLRDDVTTS